MANRLDLARRHRHSSAASSLTSEDLAEDSTARQAMEAVKHGFQSSLSSMSTTKQVEEVTVTEMPLEAEVTETVTTRSIIDDSERAAIAKGIELTIDPSVRVTRVNSIIDWVRSLISNLPDHDGSSLAAVDIDSYLEYIAEQRLIDMPTKGSDWDRVLTAGQFLGFQLQAFEEKISKFVARTRDLCNVGLASCRALLELGSDQAGALLPTFSVLHDLALLITQITRIPHLDQASEHVQNTLVDLYADLIHLVGDVSAYFCRTVESMTASSVTVDIHERYGKQIQNIWDKKRILIDQMWKAKIGHQNYSLSLNSVRSHLHPQILSLGSLYERTTRVAGRTEGTGAWLKGHLVEFLRGEDKENVFTITGAPGSGKSVLAGWIQERLQRSLEHRQYDAVFFAFPFDSPAETTVLAFLKSVLFQLLERNVGDVKLYSRLVEAFDSYHHSHNTEELEASLWSAWEIGLRTVNHSLADLVIVVDGFDSLPGEGKPQAFHKKLHDSIAKFKSIRAVTLSRPMSHLSSGSKHLSISASHIADDVRTFFYQSFATAGWFTALNAEEKDHLVDDLVKHAKDSFLWAYLASRLVKGKSSSHGLGTVDDLLPKVMQRIDIKDQTTKDLLLFLLIAKRPLSVDELAELLSVDIRAHTLGHAVNAKKHIAEHCSDIVVVVNNRVHYRSLQIRQYMEGLLGKSLPSKQDAQLRFTMHLLLCAKLRMPANYQPSFEVLGAESVRETLCSHAILDYAVRHWVDHLQLSSAYRDNGELKVTNDLRAVFPDSVFFALLERSCWHGNSGGDSLQKILPRHEFALKVREACFYEKHITVLQSLIILAGVHLAFADVTQSEFRGVEFYYRASRLGRAILSLSHPVVITCVDRFLHYTATLKFTTRTKIVTYREEMLRLIIEISSTKYGPTSDAVIRWYNVLLELYISIHEERNVYIIRQKLCEIYIIVYGPKSPQVRDVLKVLLKKGVPGGEIIPDDFGFDTCDEDGEDEVDILVLLARAASYEKHGKWTFAEKIYVTLWRRITVHCRVQATVELHVLKLKIAIQYARFLRERKRIEEASNILVCIWAEYEKATFDSLEIIVLMREVAVLFKAFGLLQIAVKVCGWVWGWFKGKGKAHDGEADKVTILITEIIEEITETTVTTKTTTTTTIETIETVIKEVYVTHYERCRHSKADTVFLKSCIALLSLYVQQQNWAQVEIVVKQTLEITWKAMLSVDVKIKLTEHHIQECITIARQLAICYHQQRRFELAEQTYLRLFYACIHSLKLDDASVEQVTLVLIAFYEEYHRHDKIIEIYTLLLEMHRKQLGAAHHRTIDILYALAGQCRLLGRKDAYVYYKEIVTVVNKGHKHCQRQAFDAAVILCEYYHTEKMWSELQGICHLLWETFLHHHQECAFTEEIIQVVYERYLYVLEFHAKVDYTVLYKLSVQYRETVVLVFGAAASITILALIALAKICERHESHYHESITIYEEFIKKISTTKTVTTTVTETTVTTVKTRLSRMYVTIITTGSSGTVTTTTIDRAIQLCLEAYLLLKAKFGCWHETTLAKLKDIVILYQKLATAEARVKIIEIVQTAVIEIITTAKVTIALYNAATTLASIYVLANLTKEAHALVHQLHHLLIFGDSFPSSEITLKFSVVSSATPASLVFLVAFEQHLHQKTTRTGSEILATIALETFLYKQYQLAVEANTDIVATLIATANLRAFWEETKQTQLVVVLDKRIFAIFKTHYASSIKTGDDSARIYYIALLQGLASSRAAGPDFALVACRAANRSVKSLLDAGDFKLGLEVAHCASQFAIKQGFYRRHDGMAYGYKLAEYLVGIEAKRCTDAVLQKSMSEMSLAITKEVLDTMRAEKINFVGLPNDVLSGLVRLFGVQENWSELTTLLLDLWQSREVQKTWDAETVLSIGRALVHTHAARGNLIAATELCANICYNLRRSQGWLSREALDMSQLLASLYVRRNHVADAMSVHEAVLREIDNTIAAMPKKNIGNHTNGSTVRDEDGDDDDVDPTYLAAQATLHLELLKRAHLRLKGWTKSESEFKDLYTRLLAKCKRAGVTISLPEHWDAFMAQGRDKPLDGMGVYSVPKEWSLTLGKKKAPVAVTGCGQAWLPDKPANNGHAPNGVDGGKQGVLAKSRGRAYRVASQLYLVR